MGSGHGAASRKGLDRRTQVLRRSLSQPPRLEEFLRALCGESILHDAAATSGLVILSDVSESATGALNFTPGKTLSTDANRNARLGAKFLRASASRRTNAQLAEMLSTSPNRCSLSVAGKKPFNIEVWKPGCVDTFWEQT